MQPRVCNHVASRLVIASGFAFVELESTSTDALGILGATTLRHGVIALAAIKATSFHALLLSVLCLLLDLAKAAQRLCR